MRLGHLLTFWIRAAIPQTSEWTTGDSSSFIQYLSNAKYMSRVMLILRSFRFRIRTLPTNTWIQSITFQTASESTYSSGQRIKMTFQVFYVASYPHKKMLKQLTYQVRLYWLLRVKRCQISISRIGGKITSSTDDISHECAAFCFTCNLQKWVYMISFCQLHKSNLISKCVDPLKGQSQMSSLKDFFYEWL